MKDVEIEFTIRAMRANTGDVAFEAELNVYPGDDGKESWEWSEKGGFENRKEAVKMLRRVVHEYLGNVLRINSHRWLDVSMDYQKLLEESWNARYKESWDAWYKREEIV